MRVRTELAWGRSIRRASRVRPSTTKYVSTEVHADHWVRALPRLGGRSIATVAELPAVYLQSRTSQAPRSTPTLSESTDLLVHVATVREQAIDRAGREWQSRLNPSAGGTHAVEPLLLQDGRWFIGDPDGWQEVLVSSSAAGHLLNGLRLAARIERPTAAIYAIADPKLLFQRYPRGESLLWRDAGAFLTTAHLAASALGLASTIVGCACEVGRTTKRASCLGAVLLGSQ